MACRAGAARSASRPAPPVTGSRSPAATRAPASPRPTWGACSNPFSPPASATTRGWACTSCTTSPPMCWAARSRPPAAAATPASCCAAPARLPCCPPFLYPPAPLPEGPVHEHPAPPAPVLPPVPADRDLRGRFLAYGNWSFRTLGRLKVSGPMHAGIVASKHVIADALPPPLFIIESYLTCMQMAAPGTDGTRLAVLEARLGQLREQHAARQRFWAQRHDPALTPLLQAVADPAAIFYALADTRLIPALRHADHAAVAAAQAQMAAAYERHRLAVDALVAHAGGVAAATEASAAARIDAATTRLRWILCAALGLSMAAAVLIRRSITLPLRDALAVAQRVAAGDMAAYPHPRFADEPGQLLDALDSMRASLAARLAERSAAERSLRSAKELTERLIASANVMIVGLDRAGRVALFNEAASAITG